MKYRKKPVIVEAYQTDKEMIIHTLEGDMKADADKFLDLLKNSSEGFWRKKQMVNGEPLSEAMSYEMNTIRKCVADADAKAEFAPKWIRVEDRLPESQSIGDKDYSEWVIVAMRIHYDGSYHETCAYYCFSEKEWYTNGFIIGDVIAWMPIPKYEGVE